MCGRYTFSTLDWEVRELFERVGALAREATEAVNRPGRRRYNIVPTSREPIVRAADGGARVDEAHWWLLPSWAIGSGARVAWRRDKAGAKSFSWKGAPRSHFNSRRDTLTDPANRYWNGLLDARRCLVPADGFIEWPDDALRPKDAPKIPRYFTLPERRPFFFAGIWDEATNDEGAPFLSFNIVTTTPNALLRELPHHRMPAILEDGDAAKWLSRDVRAAEAATLLQPFPDDRMSGYAIANLVNSPANEFAEMLLPRSAEEEDEGEPVLPGLW
jgi:putative SOS response-associated peptidase YedK